MRREFMENTFDLLELIKTRRSIRKYKGKEVSKELIMKVLEAGSWAPSASNNQPWRFVVVSDIDLIKKIGASSTVIGVINRFVETAPVIVVIFSQAHHRWVDLDCGICAQNIMLEAHSLGLGTCFIGAFRRNNIKNILGIPEKARIIGLITLGYTGEEEQPTPRYEIDKIVFFDRVSNLKSQVGKGKNFILNFVGKILKK
jgi:nitroreductase